MTFLAIKGNEHIPKVINVNHIKVIYIVKKKGEKKPKITIITGSGVFHCYPEDIEIIRDDKFGEFLKKFIEEVGAK